MNIVESYVNVHTIIIVLIFIGYIGKMLNSNPDVISLWNYHREILLTQHPYFAFADDAAAPSAAGPAGGAAAADEKSAASPVSAAVMVSYRDELKLSAAAILKNPKSCELRSACVYYCFFPSQ
jgi:hypothetical protein